MAKVQGSEAIYAAARQFVDRCLAADDSLFTPGRAIWTKDNAEDLNERVIERPEISVGTFADKMPRQLEDAPPSVVQLAGEIAYVHYLFIFDIKGGTKRRAVEKLLATAGSLQEIPGGLADVLDIGLASWGPGKAKQQDQVRFLIKVAATWKAASDEQRSSAVDDPWEFKRFLYGLDARGAQAQREALLHLVHPDTFEPIIALAHKNQLVKAFSKRMTFETDDVDRAILDIRQSLDAEYGKSVHFYREPVKSMWLGPSKPTDRPRPTADERGSEQKRNRGEVSKSLGSGEQSGAGDRFVWTASDVDVISPEPGAIPLKTPSASSEGEKRGSPPIFKRVEYTLAKLIQDIEIGEIGLPDIQRPFVWPNTKVRDLFDSMYRGFPVGYLLFWATAVPEGHRQIGADQKQKVPQLVIVDGQQRLTSLYAVIAGARVLRENWSKEAIQIAFSPVSERFEVSDAAIRRDPEFIPNISEVWATPPIRFVRRFVERLRERRYVTDDEEERLAEAIDRVYDLRSYPFTALELSSTVEEEDVAEVFVRVNSQGTLLSQADFILTLMSVFWDKGRRALEEFSRAAREPSRAGPSAFNYFIQPAPDQLLRVTVGLAFRRARLQYVYSILRGKDLATGQFSADRRTEQFEALEEAQEYVLDLQSWHDFFKSVMQAGFRHGGMVSSKIGLMFCYLMYLIGKRDFGVEAHTLRGVMARWFFMTALTGRYTGSPETVMERDLARLEEVHDGSGFVLLLDRIIGETLTTDYWNIGLPNELATSSPLSPSLSAYHAALVLLDARALFSKLKVSELLDPSLKAKRAAVERHHLFPKGYLSRLGITRPRDTNQIANMTLVEWPDNAVISDTPPSEYWPRLAARLGPQELRASMFAHGLFEGWEQLDYALFLERRRKQMAAVIAEGFRKLGGHFGGDREREEEKERLSAAKSRRQSTQELIDSGESAFVEFKESARWSHIHGEKEKTSEREVVRTLAGLLNARGGSLVLGVNDQGEVVGLAKDYKSIQGRPNRDGFENWITGVLREWLGGAAVAHLSTRFDVIGGRDVCRMDADPSPTPVFAADRHFFLRLGNTTQELNMRETQEYIRSRWPHL